MRHLRQVCLVLLAWAAGLTTGAAWADPSPSSSPSLEGSAKSVAAALDLYQEFSGRTVIRSPDLPVSEVSFRVDLSVPPLEAAAALDQQLQQAGVQLQPVGGLFAAALPRGATNPLAAHPPPESAAGTNRRSSVLPPGMLRFHDADMSAVLDVWQELDGRTVLRPTILPVRRITVRSQTPLTRPEAAWLLAAALRLAGLEIIAETEQLVFALPSGRAQNRPRFDRETLERRAIARFAPDTEWKLPSVGPGEMVQAYASITRRRPTVSPAPSPSASSLPLARFVMRTQTPLKQAEAIYALEAVAWANGFRFETIALDRFQLLGPDTAGPTNSFRRIPPRSDRAGLARTEAIVKSDLETKQREFGDSHPEVAKLLSELGRLISRRNAPAEAEGFYRQALHIQRHRSPLNRSALESAILEVADCLQAQKRTADMDRFLEEFLLNEAPDSDGLPGVWRWRGSARARQSRWAESTADLRKALEGRSDDVTIWAALAPLLIEQGDLEAYRAHRNFMLARFRSATNVINAERVARATLLLPLDDPGLSAAVSLAQVAADRGTNVTASFAERLARVVQRGATNPESIKRFDPANPPASFSERLASLAGRPINPSGPTSNASGRVTAYFGGKSSLLFTAALAEYRAGRFAEAADRLEQTRAASEGLPPSLLDGQRLFALALVRHRMDQPEAARAAYDEGVMFVGARLPASDAIDLGQHWDQVLIARILMREARALVEPSTPAVR